LLDPLEIIDWPYQELNDRNILCREL